MELCMYEKAVFFLPVNILTVWSLAFLAARHTIVCLDILFLAGSPHGIQLHLDVHHASLSLAELSRQYKP